MLKRVAGSARSQNAVALAGIIALGLLYNALRRLGDLRLYVVETLAIALAAGALYFIALFLLERTATKKEGADGRGAFWLILAGAVLFRALLVPLVPTLSDDIYRYRWDGRVQVEGWNPYAVSPNDARLAALRDTDWRKMPGRETPSIYPPLAEHAFRITYRALPDPVRFKLPFVLADLAIVFMLAGWVHFTGGRNWTLAVYAWNPLVIVEFAGSGHNDASALACVVAALLLITRWRATPSTLLLTAGALAKVFPAVLLPVALRRAGWPRSVRSWVNAAAAAALAVGAVWRYRDAWAAIFDTLVYYESRWQNYNASLYSLLRWLTSPELAAGVGPGVVAGLAVWAAARKMDSTRAAYLLFGATLMLAPNGYSWYFTWIVPLLVFFPNPAWLLLTILQFLSYHVLIDYQASGTWHFQEKYVWLTYGPFYALLLWQYLWAKPQMNTDGHAQARENKQAGLRRVAVRRPLGRLHQKQLVNLQGRNSSNICRRARKDGGRAWKRAR